MASEFTGERFMPDCKREIWYEHWHRYVFASTLLAGRNVLDVACGEGYGSHLLAARAADVVGADIDLATVCHARARYGAQDNLRYVPASCHSLPFRDGAFDGVVSFETLEHVPEQATMVAELRRVLAADGYLILSSPNRKLYSDEQGYRNPFHVRELYLDEFVELLGRHFGVVRLYNQKLLFHSAIWPSGTVPAKVSAVCAQAGGASPREELPYEAMYFIALCAASEEHLPEEQRLLSLFADDAESVAHHYQQSVSEVMRLDGLLGDRERIIAERDGTLEQMLEHVAQIELELRAAGECTEQLTSLLAKSRANEKQLQEILAQRERDLAYRDSWRCWLRRPFRPFKHWWTILREGGLS